MGNTDVLEIVDKKEKLTDLYNLIVWNDDVNTFENVIETLVEVCKHEYSQAEQCAMIIHNTGKCSVKNGDYYELYDMKDKITSRGITVTLELK